MFLHRLIHRDFLEIGSVFGVDADGKRAGAHVDGQKVIHSFPREKLWTLWINDGVYRWLRGCSLWIVLFRIRLLLNDGLYGIGNVNALGAVAVGQCLDELVLDDALIVEHT